MLQQKTTCPVGVFRIAGRNTELPKQRRLLISRDARDLHFAKAKRGRHLSDIFVRPDNFWQKALWNVEELQQVVVPSVFNDVVEQSARRVCAIRNVSLSAGQIPHKPAIDRAEGEFSCLGSTARSGNVIENPCDLTCGEVRAQQKSGLLTNTLFNAIVGHFLHQGTSTAVLPD